MLSTTIAILGRVAASAAWVFTLVSALTILSLATNAAQPHLLALQAAGRLHVGLGVVAVGVGVLTSRTHLPRAALVVLGCWMALALASHLAHRHAVSEAGVPVRIVSANLLWENETPERMAAAIAAQQPEVLVTVETTPELENALRAHLDPALVRVGAGKASGETQAMVWSVLPVVESGTLAVGDRNLPYAVLEKEGHRFRVVAIHTKSPATPDAVAPWRTEFADLGERMTKTTGPTVLAGDFNAANEHRVMRGLLRTFADAGAATGRPFLPTWPATSVLALDHILLRDVAVSDLSTLRTPGSDHLALSATLRLQR